MNAAIEEKMQKAMIKDLFLNIEKIKRQYNHTDYIDLVLKFCEDNGIDIEIAGKAIINDPVLKSKIQKEAEDLNVIEKTARLPV